MPFSMDTPNGRTGSPSPTRWVVFATFDSVGRPSESAVAQLQEYRGIGFDLLVVDTSPQLSEQRRSDWLNVADCWFQRPNVGYDFGSFKAGLRYLVEHERVQPGEFDVLLANDSCFGPFQPMGPIVDWFDRSAPGAYHVFGMTDSHQFVHHIQSYWMYFRSNVSKLAYEFFVEEMLEASNRAEAIANGELALGRFLADRGCVIEVLCPVGATVSRLALFKGRWAAILELGCRRLLGLWKYNRDADTQCLRYLLRLSDKVRYFSPISLFGVQLYRELRFPYVKKSLLRDNFHHDPAIPRGIDIYAMNNDDVRALLG